MDFEDAPKWEAYPWPEGRRWSVRFGKLSLIIYGTLDTDAAHALAREVAHKLNTHESLVEACDDAATALIRAAETGRGGR